MKKVAVMTGFFFAYVLIPYRRLAKKHLKLSFPEWSKQEINTCVRKIFIHFSLAFTDLICLFYEKHPVHILIEEQKLHDVINSHSRLIFLTGHIGNWELLPFLIKDLRPDSECTIIARAQSNRFLNYCLDQVRKSQGFNMLDRKKNPYQLYSSLARASHLAFLADQSLKTSRKDLVKFFGRTAPTPSALAMIAQKRKFSFIPLFCVRRDTCLYELILLDPFEAGQFPSAYDLTQHYTFIIEKIVRKFPEQWVWFHQRWREKT